MATIGKKIKKDRELNSKRKDRVRKYKNYKELVC